MFFVDIGMLDSTLVVPVISGNWRKDLMLRLHETDLPSWLYSHLVEAPWRSNGRILGDAVPSSRLLDETVRLPPPGLRGGMPSQTDYSQMSLADLRKACTGTPVSSRKRDADGKRVNKLRPELLADLQSWASNQENTVEAAGGQDEQAEIVLSSGDEECAPSSSNHVHARLDSGSVSGSQPPTQNKARPKRPNALRSLAEREADRKRKREPKALEATAKRVRELRAAQEESKTVRVQYAKARREDVVGRSDGSSSAGPVGTWRQAASRIAAAEGQEGLPIMPPSFVALNDERCLSMIGEMHSFLDQARWSTCVVCWRAWYNPKLRSAFDRMPSRSGEYAAWFNPLKSAVLGTRKSNSIDPWFLQGDGGHIGGASEH